MRSKLHLWGRNGHLWGRNGYLWDRNQAFTLLLGLLRTQYLINSETVVTMTHTTSLTLSSPNVLRKAVLATECDQMFNIGNWLDDISVSQIDISTSQIRFVRMRDLNSLISSLWGLKAGNSQRTIWEISNAQAFTEDLQVTHPLTLTAKRASLVSLGSCLVFFQSLLELS